MSAGLSLIRTLKCSHKASVRRLKLGQPRRTVQTDTIAPLPPREEWRKEFPVYAANVRERVSVSNPDTADTLVKAFLTKKSAAAGRNKIVIESFPGPGCLSRALLRLDSSIVKRLIILEDIPQYLEYLKPLEKADSRVSVIPKSGYDWDTYEYLEENGYFDEVETVPWESGVHPQLHFISHIPHGIKGEQLVSQFFRTIPEHLWLMKYGRVPMSLIMGEWLWERTTALHGTPSRCKLGVIAQAVAELQNAVRPSFLENYDDHFHPLILNHYFKENKPESRRLGHPMVATNIVPREKQIIEKGLLEKWDFVLRRLFVLKASPLKKAMSCLSPGAASLNKILTDPRLPPDEHVDLDKTIRQLNIADWALIMRAFDNWSFAPDELFIGDAFGKGKGKGKRR